jgi:hypothetical protein
MIPGLLDVKETRTVHIQPYWILHVQFLQLKVKLSLGLTKHHAINTYWGVQV